MKLLDGASGGSPVCGGSLVGGGPGRETAGSDIVSRFETLLVDAAALGDRRLVELAARFERRLQGARLLAVARLAGSAGDARADRRRARTHLRNPGQSGRSMNRDARRAAALAANEALAGQVAGGGLSGDGIDALCRAADEATGEIPDGLVEDTVGLEPDQLSRVVDRFGGADVGSGRQPQVRVSDAGTASAPVPGSSLRRRPGLGRLGDRRARRRDRPDLGGTDLDNLALLCGACHRQLHADSETLVRERSSTGASMWSCRPATAAEIPAPRSIQRE